MFRLLAHTRPAIAGAQRLLSSNTAPEALFKQGMTALASRDFDAAFGAFAQAAEDGHVRAQNAAGGICLAQRADMDGAKRFFRMAAGQGHLRSTVRLASLLSGTDVTAVEAAAKLSAAAAEVETAATEAGETGGAEQRPTAAALKEAAAALTAPPSAADVMEARRLFVAAAAQGDAEARLREGAFLLADGEVEQSAAMLAGAAKSSCEFGQEASVQLGDMLREAGRNSGGDAEAERVADEAAMRQYRHAATLAHGLAQYKLGAMLLMGKGGSDAEANREEAEQWIFLASEQGVAAAQQAWVALHPEAAADGDDAGAKAT